MLKFLKLELMIMTKLQSFRLLFTATCLTCVGVATQSSPTRAATISANNNATVLVIATAKAVRTYYYNM